MRPTVTTCVVVATGAVLAPVATLVGVKVLGFGAAGIGAGTWASSLMTTYGGVASAGSVVAVLQSTGAAGLSGGVTALCSAAGAVCGVFIAKAAAPSR
jgi:hypothetical protein